MIISLNGGYIGDFDGDGRVDYGVFGIISRAWLCGTGEAGWNKDCDLSGDGTVID